MKSFFQYLAAVALSLSAVSAIPQLERRAISPTLFQTLKTYAYYAEAAYCENNDQPLTDPTQTRPIRCGTGGTNPCGPINEAANIYLGLPPQPLTGPATGFVAVDNTTKQVIVSFRGTVDASLSLLLGELENFDRTVPVSYLTNCAGGCRIGNQTDVQWTPIRLTVFQSLRAILLTPGMESATVIFTGHSLGAAVATLAITDFRANFRATTDATAPPPSMLYSFASPRVFNRAAASYAQSLSGDNNFRVTHYKDIVVRSPAETNDHEHIGPEYYISVADLAAQTGATINQVPATGNGLNTLEGQSGSLQWRGLAGEFNPGRFVAFHRDYLIPLTSSLCRGLAAKDETLTTAELNKALQYVD